MIFRTISAFQPVRMILWAYDKERGEMRPLCENVKWASVIGALRYREKWYRNRLAGEIQTLDGKLVQTLKAGEGATFPINPDMETVH